MGIMDWLEVLGIPGLVGAIIGYLVKRIRDTDKKTVAVQLGVQSLLMDKLDYLHDKYMDDGHCPIHKKRLYENMYNQYANLGQDGVMKHAMEEVMNLPTTQPAVEDS